MNKHLLRIFACISATLMGCGTTPFTGNSVETESDFTARILLVDSVLPSWNRDLGAPTVVAIRLGPEDIDWESADSAATGLRVETTDSVSVPFEIAFWDLAARLGRLNVRLDSTQFLRGTRLLLMWDRPGRPGGPDSAAVWHGISRTKRLQANSVPVADFEDGDLRTLLPTAPSWWIGPGESASVFEQGVVVDSLGGAGLALRVRYQVTGLGYAVIQTALAAGAPALSVRALDSVVFRARGNGEMFVAVERLRGREVRKAWQLVSLDSGWTRHSVSPSTFLEPGSDSSNVGWAGVRDSATHLTFLPVAGTLVWIDDVRLHGLDRDDLR